LDTIDEVVIVEPINVLKYPVIVEKDGTLIDEKTVKEEVTWAFWVNKKLDWMEETVRVEPVREVK
jgi:hypothetical protein